MNLIGFVSEVYTMDLNEASITTSTCRGRVLLKRELYLRVLLIRSNIPTAFHEVLITSPPLQIFCHQKPHHIWFSLRYLTNLTPLSTTTFTSSSHRFPSTLGYLLLDSSDFGPKLLVSQSTTTGTGNSNKILGYLRRLRQTSLKEEL